MDKRLLLVQMTCHRFNHKSWSTFALLQHENHAIPRYNYFLNLFSDLTPHPTVHHSDHGPQVFFSEDNFPEYSPHAHLPNGGAVINSFLYIDASANVVKNSPWYEVVFTLASSVTMHYVL